jgi:hypothetical protein
MEDENVGVVVGRNEAKVEEDFGGVFVKVDVSERMTIHERLRL